MSEEEKSNCCSAPVIIGGDDSEGTHYYVCTSCKEPCDLEEFMPKSIIKRFKEQFSELNHIIHADKNGNETTKLEEVEQFLLVELQALKEEALKIKFTILEDDKYEQGYIEGWNEHFDNVDEVFEKFGIK